jgi:site-specific DNA-methyltransferase (adenine-specific)
MLNYKEVHYIKVLTDTIFGRDNFLGSLVWVYDVGAISHSKWTMKHIDILYYVKDKKNYTFNFDNIPRIPYMTPKLAGKEKAERGKILKSWWFSTIPCGYERQEYSDQKPLNILKNMIDVSSNPGDLVLDPFGGSGSTAKACEELKRKYIVIDQNIESINVMKKWLKSFKFINYT